jgi:hypothetical protein
MIEEQQHHHSKNMDKLNYNQFRQSDDERLVFEVLVDSFKDELNKLLYSSLDINDHTDNFNSRTQSQKQQKSPSRLLAIIKKKQLFTILFQSKSNSQLDEEILVNI